MGIIRLLRWVLIAALLAVAAGIVKTTVSDISESNGIERNIVEREREIDAARSKLAAAQQRVNDFRDSVRALPDSLRDTTMGLAMRRAASMGKIMDIQDSRIRRANVIIDKRKAALRATRAHLRRWNVALASAGVVLLAGWFLLGRKVTS